MAELLTPADKTEALSCVYVKALAARAGFVTSVPSPDRDSVDLRIQAGGPFSPALEIQLKGTASLDPEKSGYRSFRLSAKNYRDLRANSQTPRLLVVVELPKDEVEWVTVTGEELVLRRRAYWLSLRGAGEEVAGRQTVTVRIPEENRLDVEALRHLIERSRSGEI